MSNLLGVVLCGGQSKRMGADKGLLIRDGKHWAVLIAEKLQHASLDVAVSVNETQIDNYRAIFPDKPLVVDELAIDGPLDGLLSIYKNYPEKDLLLMACDLIDMDEKTIFNLITAYQNQPFFDYYVYELHGFTQPFCAIYTAKALRNVYQAYQDEALKKYSLHDRFESGNTLYLPSLDEESFRNYNHENS